jgi:serine/threonine-protein kinase
VEGASRYEIVDILARGDFAAVYRARDRELDRGVAIKQIHEQYLADSRQLARYWQEAQLLASLQHPNILTIYDIVRSRGWLILELMHGSLQSATQAEGIDLDYLRLVLAGCLSGLQFLHSQGVIHGDIKPSNLLVDGQGRVKLGDFGLARRASDEQGSLLKGTTKYMAPELLSAQFGPIGPASDLYSLGFSAYELLCGSQFETLFPGLDSFGRDRQIAWMMWHAAADRKMPPIHRVFEGVPDDLAQIVERLIIKDQSQRYQSAKDVLRDLQPAPPAIRQRAETVAEAAQAETVRQKRRKRRVALLAVTVSLLLSALMLWPAKPKSGPSPAAKSIRGTVLHVYPDEHRIALKVIETSAGKPNERVEEIRLTPRYDKVLINDKVEPLDQVAPNDAVRIETIRDASGRRITEVHAHRPEISRGTIRSVRADAGQLTLTVADSRGEDKKAELTIAVPPHLKITLNGDVLPNVRPVTLADLHADDAVVVHHLGAETGREATAMSIERVVTTEGIVRDIAVDDVTKQAKLSLEVDVGKHATVVLLPFADSCEITVNKLASIMEQRLRPTDLLPGDQATVSHDARIVRLGASRVLHDCGIIDEVRANALDVIRQDERQLTSYHIGTNCTITLNGEPAELRDLRNGDAVEITHHSLDRRNIEAVAAAVRRASDRHRWAILVGIQDYEDRSLSRLEYPVADAKLLRDTLVGRRQIPEDQVLLVTDESRLRLEQSISARLGQIGSDDKLLVFFAGHAYKDEKGKVYLAPKNFDPRRIGATGLPLEWLVDELEKCSAKEKLLLLDGSHAGEGKDLAMEPSTAEMLRTLKSPPGRSPLRTVAVIASCGAGQRGADWPEKRHGLFAWCLAQGYAGAADKNRDNRLEPTELFGYLQKEMAVAPARLKGSQTPELFLPDDRPPRLSEEAKAAIRKLAARLRQDRINLSEAAADYAAAVAAAGQQIEPKLVYGLLLLKDKQRDPALKQFEEMKIQRPDLLLPLQGIAWARFEKRAYQAGLEELTELVSKIPKPSSAADSYPEAQRQVLSWIGQLREYAVLTVEPSRRPSADSLATLDATVARCTIEGQRLYEGGRAKSRAIHAEFQQRIAAAESEALAARLKVERRGMLHYVEFPYSQSVQQVMDGLEQ